MRIIRGVNLGVLGEYAESISAYSPNTQGFCLLIPISSPPFSAYGESILAYIENTRSQSRRIRRIRGVNLGVFSLYAVNQKAPVPQTVLAMNKNPGILYVSG